jgi:hypothetical protein
MAKSSALGSSFYVGVYDLSGDTGAIGGLNSMQAVQNTSSIQTRGTERIGLRRDGSISYTAFWNPASGQAVPVLADLPTAAQVTCVKGPGGLGAYAASLRAVKTTFSAALGQDGTLGVTGEALGSRGQPLEWGRMLTADKQTITATQLVAAWQATHDYALNDLVQPTVPNGHFYKVTADAGSSAGSEPTWPTNGTTVVDDGITWTDQGLVPNGIDRGAGTASDHGAAAYLHVFSIGSGSATITIQDSSDRVAWADVPAAVFTAITAATTQRVATSTTENVKRYVRAYPTGSFTTLVAAINFVPYTR